MAGMVDTKIDDNKCILVSDSNEIGGQYDSKKLTQAQLVELAQDNLCKKFLDTSRYLTVDQYTSYKSLLENQLSIYQTMFN